MSRFARFECLLAAGLLVSPAALGQEYPARVIRIVVAQAPASGPDLLARALAQEAPVLLLDEPTSALDIGHQQQALELVTELREHSGLTVVCVSNDLPFALGRFCGAEGIENVTSASAFRDSFGEDYGVTITDGPMAGLLARAVVVIDADGTVTYTELVPEIASEPDYDAALAAARP